MREMINYSIEANLALLLFLLAYRLVLSRETDFGLMRFFLLAGIFISVAFPFIKYNQHAVLPSVNDILPANWLPEIVIGGSQQVSAHSDNTNNAWQVVSYFYWAGVVIFLGGLILQFVNIIKILRKGVSYSMGRLRIIASPENNPAFSFFNIIYIGGAHELTDSEKQQIIRHEAVHAQQWHSLDILLVTLLQIVFWFNPFINLYKKTFIQLHEFEADARAAKDSDVDKYCTLLARVALASVNFPIASHFNHSLTLKRIEMIRTIKKKMRPWKIAALAAILPISFFIVACHDQVNEPRKSPADKTDITPSENVPENGIYTAVEKMPEYQGGYEALADFMTKNMRYPKAAREAGISGTVFASMVVHTDGTLSDIQILKGIDPTLDAEALRVVKLLPRWIPGEQNGTPVKTRFILPIRFDLSQTSHLILPERHSVDPYKMKVVTQGIFTGGKKIIKGTVTDENDNPLSGTHIILKGTATGTTADTQVDLPWLYPMTTSNCLFLLLGLKPERSQSEFT